MTVSAMKFTRASKAQVRTGLLGWVTFDLEGLLHLDGVALRRTRSGRLALSFPARLDSAGRQHPIVRPIDDDARREIERQVLAALGVTEGASR